jgi:chloramphenicol O-acetyltransferase type B
MESKDFHIQIPQYKRLPPLLNLIRVFVRSMRMKKIHITLLIFGGSLSRSNNTVIGPSCSFVSAGKIQLGANSGMGAKCHVETNLIIGDGTLISSNVAFIGNDHSTKPGETLSLERRPKSTIVIGSRCWIGYGAILIGNIEIADECIIGAGSVVTKTISESGTYAGSPARRIK